MDLRASYKSKAVKLCDHMERCKNSVNPGMSVPCAIRIIQQLCYQHMVPGKWADALGYFLSLGPSCDGLSLLLQDKKSVDWVYSSEARY